MATCKNCGNKYYNSICQCITNPYYKKIQDKKKNSLLKASIVTLVIVSIIGLFGASVYEINRLNNKVVEKNKKIIELKNHNEYLYDKNKKQTSTIKKLSSNNYKKNRNRYALKPRTYTKPKTYNKTKIKKEQKNKTNTYSKKTTETKIYSNTYNTKTTAPKTYSNSVKKTDNKIYQKFSKNIKLVSDSRITIDKNNRIKSTMPIIGRFYPKNYSIINTAKNQIANIKCNLKNNRYKVVDECSMQISEKFDTVYLGKMNSKTIKNFNYKTHMIECKYNKEYGVMGDCRIKMKS